MAMLTSDSDFVQCQTCGGPCVPTLDHPEVASFRRNELDELRCLACNRAQAASDAAFDKAERMANGMTLDEMLDARDWWRVRRREEKAKYERAMRGEW